MKHKIWLICFACLGFVACARLSEQYAYVPRQAGEIPATIEVFQQIGADTGRDIITGDTTYIYGLQIRVKKVNDTYVHMSKTNPQIRDNKIFLSPGPTKIELEIVVLRTVGQIPVILNAVSGERYSLHVESNKYWIANSAGLHVNEGTFTVR